MAVGDLTSVQAKTGKGMTFSYDPAFGGDPAAVTTWTKIEGMKSGALPAPDKPEIDVTTTDDEVKAFIAGLGSVQDLSMEFNFYPGNETHQTILTTLLYKDTPFPWKISGQGMAVTFMGYIKGAPVSFSPDAAMTMPLTLKVSSKPDITFTTADG